MKKIELVKSTTFIQKLFGLIPFKSLQQNQVMLIKNCRSIHTFFMQFPIDVIFVDKNDVIVKLKENLKSYKFLCSNFKVKNTYETYAGFIKRYNLKIGDNIRTLFNEKNDLLNSAGVLTCIKSKGM